MNLRIRDVTPADAAAVCAIINPIIATRAYTVFDAPFTVEAEHDYMSRFPPRGVWKLALREADERVIGLPGARAAGPTIAGRSITSPAWAPTWI